MTSEVSDTPESPVALYRRALELGEALVQRIAEGDWDGVIALQEQRDRIAASCQASLGTLAHEDRGEALRLLQAINAQLLREGHGIRVAMQRNRAEGMHASRTSGALQGYGVASVPILEDDEAPGLDVQH
ncbi:MAG: hypothetical protein VKO64_02500 [Candidatus Sericytochromatia bacterium]|nr:hypothetical protein [Candidatus Sericytochromatia bacterium]